MAEVVAGNTAGRTLAYPNGEQIVDEGDGDRALERAV